LVQKIEWKQTDGHNPIWLPSCYTHTPVQRPFVWDNPLGRYQKGKTNLDFTEARDSQWQWHQLGHVQVCTSLQADNHASSPPLSFFYRPDALPATEPTVSKHLTQIIQEAQLSPSDCAMRPVSSNLANYHATVQKLLV